MSEDFGYLALSLDGYIAGPGDDLSFLPAPEVEGEDHGFFWGHRCKVVEFVNAVVFERLNEGKLEHES